MSTATMHTITDARTGRLKARTVRAESLASDAAAKAAETGKPSIKLRHGGSVCNTYGYPAQTEAVMTVAVHFRGQIHVAIYAAQLAANKVSHGGAAACCMGEVARPLFDERYGEAKTAAARKKVVREALSDICCDMDPAAAAKRLKRSERTTQRPQPSLRSRLASYKAKLNEARWAERREALERETAERRAAEQRERERQAEAEYRGERQAEAEYRDLVMASMPSSRILFDAEGGFRAENN